MRFRIKIGMQIRRNWMGYVSKKKKNTKKIIVLCRINWWWWWGAGIASFKNGAEFGFIGVIGVLRHIQRYFSIMYYIWSEKYAGMQNALLSKRIEGVTILDRGWKRTMEHYNTSITLEVSDITLEHIGIM